MSARRSLGAALVVLLALGSAGCSAFGLDTAPEPGAHGGSATDLPAHLDQMALSAGTPPADQVACDLWFQGTYYFSHNADPERRDRAIRNALAADPSLRGTEALLLTPAPPEAHGYRPLRRLGFEEGERWTPGGDAFTL